MPPRQKLSLHLERAVADLQAASSEIAGRFERDLRATVSDMHSAIMCVSGCAHCCYYPITTSVLEGMRLYRYLVRQGMWTPSLKRRLQEHSGKTFELSAEIWLLSLLPCPLLDDKNRCSAYSSRPLACQVTYAIGDPHYCHPHRVGASNPIVPRAQTLRGYHHIEGQLFRANGAILLLVPLSKALLLAEQVASGELPFEHLNRQMAKEYSDT